MKAWAEQNRCSSLSRAVKWELRDEEIQRLGIKATDAEVRQQKLDEAIDELLSRSDPKFQEYKSELPVELRQQYNFGLPHYQNNPHILYIQQQRVTYWHKVARSAEIVIEDPIMLSCPIEYAPILRVVPNK
jgi:hypothetical protein